MSKLKVAVIGAGLMGCGIAQACAQAEHDVINVDLSEKAIEKAKGTLKKLFEALDLAIYNKSRGFLNVKTVLAGVIAFYGIKKLRKSNAILSFSREERIALLLFNKEVER